MNNRVLVVRVRPGQRVLIIGERERRHRRRHNRHHHRHHHCRRRCGLFY